jgi:hypothetical protein
VLDMSAGLLPAPSSGWWVSDTYGTYHFPDRWLVPGEEIRVWSGSGHDDNSNLYAGRRSPVWVISVSYYLSYFYKGQGIIWGKSAATQASLSTALLSLSDGSAPNAAGIPRAAALPAPRI